MEIHKLIFDAWRRSYVADADIISLTRPRDAGTFVHTQDFFEVMYVIKGEAKHYINGATLELVTGDLIVVRPGDYHDIGVLPDHELHFHNVFIRNEIWREYCHMVEIDPMNPRGSSTQETCWTNVPTGERIACRNTFDDSALLLHENPTKLSVYRFLGIALGYLRHIHVERTHSDGSQPAWLPQACRAMHDWQNLADGLPKFVELSGVSVSYLSRVLKATTGQSPTEYITALRLKRSAALLATTNLTIAEIALDSGFENLSYYYRRFQQHFGKTPRQYRKECRQLVDAETI
jgi:AraC-like DNA-binding protein